MVVIKLAMRSWRMLAVYMHSAGRLLLRLLRPVVKVMVCFVFILHPLTPLRDQYQHVLIPDTAPAEVEPATLPDALLDLPYSSNAVHSV